MRPLRKTVVALLIAVAGLMLVSTPARPEQGSRPRVGILLPQSPSLAQQMREQLRARGYIDGENVKFDWRPYKTWDARMRTISADLVRSNPDLIVAFGTPPAHAVLEATKTIPVVFVAGEPVRCRPCFHS